MQLPGSLLQRPLAWRRRPSDWRPENFELLAVWLARDTTAPDQSGDYFSEKYPGTSAKSANIPPTLLRRVQNPSLIQPIPKAVVLVSALR